jgi:hypothetical protein
MTENRWSDVITSEDGDYVGVDEADDALQKAQAEITRLREGNDEYLRMYNSEVDETFNLRREVMRLHEIISEPVRSFGTPELIAWANRLHEIIAEYPEENRGNAAFVFTMGDHLEKFVKAWNSQTIANLEQRITELEGALRPFAEMGPAFVEGETLKGQILVILQRDDVEKARAVLEKKEVAP